MDFFDGLILCFYWTLSLFALFKLWLKTLTSYLHAYKWVFIFNVKRYIIKKRWNSKNISQSQDQDQRFDILKFTICILSIINLINKRWERIINLVYANYQSSFLNRFINLFFTCSIKNYLFSKPIGIRLTPKRNSPVPNFNILWEKIFWANPYYLWERKNTTIEVTMKNREGLMLFIKSLIFTCLFI
jgi:hypothetical protein